MSDVSYDYQLAEDVCSCAAMIACQRNGNRASVTWVEQSDHFSTGNYCAEILGGIALQMIIRTACDGKYISPSARPEIGCGNNGVVHHGRYPWRPLPAKQSQAVVLRSIVTLSKLALSSANFIMFTVISINIWLPWVVSS